MNAFSNDKILRATELTRAGKLLEAVAVLRGQQSAPPLADKAAKMPQPNLLDRLAAFIRKAGGAPSYKAPAPHPQPAPGAKFEARLFAGPHGQRDYKIFVPSSYHGKALPLVVMLHGCTQNPDDFAVGTRMNEVAEEMGFLVAYPAQSPSANMNRCWNWFNPTDQRRDAGEPAIVAGIAGALGEEFAVKKGAVFAAGLSAGGALAAILGAQYPDVFAAIGVHSGLAYGAASDMGGAFVAMRRGGVGATCVDARLVPTIVFHGDGDKTVNPINAEAVILQARAGDVLESATMEGEVKGVGYTRTVQKAANGKPVLETWMLHGAGHAWSGGNSGGSFASDRGPDASREMARFFMLNMRAR